jgi:hypothetical protein
MNRRSISTQTRPALHNLPLMASDIHLMSYIQMCPDVGPSHSHRVGWYSGNTLDSYSLGAQFESPTGHRLP